MDIDLGKVTLATIIAIFIGVIFVMAIIPTIADEQGKMTTKSIITDESQLIGSARNATHYIVNTTTFNVAEDNVDGGTTEAWKKTSCLLTSITLKNGSNATVIDGTDFEFTESIGNFSLQPTGAWNDTSENGTWVTYTHCRDGYATEGSTRAIINLILVFAGLAVMGFVIFNIFKK